MTADPELVNEVLEHSRALLADIAGRRHDHRGPNPCPVCGGMAEPRLKDQP